MSILLMVLPFLTYGIQINHTSLCQNFPGLCTCRVLAIYRTYVARRGSNRCCLRHLYGEQPKGTNTNEPYVDLVITPVSPTATTFLLTGRASFVVMPKNNYSLFHRLADAIREFHPPQRKKVISTYGRNDVSSVIADLSDLSCTHEEAYTRLLSHASHSFHHAFTKHLPS